MTNWVKPSDAAVGPWLPVQVTPHAVAQAVEDGHDTLTALAAYLRVEVGELALDLAEMEDKALVSRRRDGDGITRYRVIGWSS